jgi:hypothetical protein
MPDIPATKKQCMSCTESKRLNSIYSWWVKKNQLNLILVSEKVKHLKNRSPNGNAKQVS